MPAGSKVHLPLAKVQAVGDLSGSASKGTYLKRVKKNQHNRNCSWREE